jgi:Protein of unknown function (DUF3363)
VTYAANGTAGHWKAHGRYIARDSATQPGKDLPSGFNAEGAVRDIGAALASWQEARDERVFKLIISPEFGERMDLTAHTRGLMADMAQDLETPLEWVAVVHHNTDHPHVHVALRGRASDGAGLTIPRQYIQKGLRLRAEDQATRQIGVRTQADIEEAHRREVFQHRYTTIDRTIQKRQVSEQRGEDFTVTANPAAGGLRSYQRQMEQFVANRLHALTAMHLADQISPTEWRVRGNFADVLRTLQRVADRQKTLAKHSALISDVRLPLQIDDWRKLRNVEGRVLGHGEEESTGKSYMLLEGTDAKIHYLPHNGSIEEARQKGELKPNSFVTLKRTMINGRVSHRLHSHESADSLLSDRTFLGSRAAQALRQASHSGTPLPDANAGPVYAGWLGKYRAALNQHIEELRVEREERSQGRDVVPPQRHRRKEVGR